MVWGRRIRRLGIAGFVCNAAGFFGAEAGLIHDYPYIPVALGFALASWVGRVLIVKARQSVVVEPDSAGDDALAA